VSKQPTFSIIIPHYRDDFFEDIFLIDCLTSVKNQTFANFECLLILDGDNIKSEEIFADVVGNDARFILIKQAHAGLHKTRLNGIKNAAGSWIISLDSDDYFVDNNGLKSIHTAIQNAAETAKPVLIGGIKNVDMYEKPQRHLADSWLVYMQYSISMCAIPRSWLRFKDSEMEGVFDFDVYATLAPLIDNQAKIWMLPKTAVFYRQRSGSLNYIKETQTPRLEIDQAIGTYKKLLQLKKLTWRQKCLCWLAIWRYKLTPPKHLFNRILRGILTKISKHLSGSKWKKT